MTNLQKENLNHIPCQPPGVCLKSDWFVWVSEFRQKSRKIWKFREIRKIRQIQKNQTTSDKFRPTFRQIQKKQTNSDQDSDKFRKKIRQKKANQTNSAHFLSVFVWICLVFWICLNFGLYLSEFWSAFVWIWSEFVWMCLSLSEFVWMCLNLSEFVWICLLLSDFLNLSECSEFSDFSEVLSDFLSESEFVWIGLHVCERALVWHFCLAFWPDLLANQSRSLIVNVILTLSMSLFLCLSLSLSLFSLSISLSSLSFSPLFSSTLLVRSLCLCPSPSLLSLSHLPSKYIHPFIHDFDNFNIISLRPSYA